MTIYDTAFGYDLFSRDAFPVDVSSYLDEETALVRSRLRSSDALIEMGSGKGENAHLAAELVRDYLGIDPAAAYIAAARHRLGEASQRTFLHASAEDFSTWSLFIKAAWRSPLLFMPFNCLGNVENPSTALRAIGRYGGRFVLSVFSDTAQATRAREDYYRRAGFEGRFEPCAWGVQFVSQVGWRSIGFSDAALRNAATAAGLTARTISLGDVGLALLDDSS